jgi:hypothetical protein
LESFLQLVWIIEIDGLSKRLRLRWPGETPVLAFESNFRSDETATVSSAADKELNLF